MKRIFFILPILILIGVSTYFILTTSTFVRYWVDDFCAAIPVRDGGLWGAQVGWWFNWTGRYSYVFFLDLFEMIGPWIVRFLPIFMLTLLIVPLVLIFSFEIILAPLLIILILINAPNLIQSFYWQTGALNYTAEYIFLNFFYLLLSRPKTKFTVPLAFVLTLIAGGFSESYAATQIVLLLFTLIIAFVTNFESQRLRVKIIISGLFGAIFSIIIMSLSPGNVVRASISGHLPSFYLVIESTLYGTKWYLERMLFIKPFTMSLFLLASAIFITVDKKWEMFKKLYLGKKKMLAIMLLLILMAIFSTSAVIFSGYYSSAVTPPERTMFIAIYAIFVSFVVFCFSGSVLLRNSLSERLSYSFTILSTFIVVFCSCYLIKSTVSHWEDIRTEFQTYIQEWEPQEKKLINASKESKKVVEIDNVQSVGELDDFVQNKKWVLGCLRAYYNLEEIRLK